ncbi:MAG: DUF5615 family PIN-like protein [Planctomycetes bacterium]|nr:DUF5615 family PIN-like protein [Planctomycetota bacterium]
MRLLTDENVDAPLVRWLRGLGHDVASVQEDASGASDLEIANQAVTGNRCLITFDRDFGDIIFRKGVRPPGVAYFRIRAGSPEHLFIQFTSLWPDVEQRLLEHFVTATPRRIRVRALPHRSNL